MRECAVALAIGLILIGCRAPAAGIGGSSAIPPPPSFGNQPLDWDELDSIEAWLTGAGPGHYPDRRVEAELLLAEGRLRYAREDQPRIPAATWDRRVRAAEAGFQRALRADGSTGLQRHRARRGLEDVQQMRVKPAEPVARGLEIQPRESWKARAPVRARMSRNPVGWSRITVHHSAPAQGGALSGPASVPGEIQRIQRYHMEQTSPRCGDIGYHFLIDPWGEVYEGRDLSWQGAHAGGANNRGNIGICLLGNFESSRPSSAALASLERLLGELTEKYRIKRNGAGILGHGELRTTVCPGRNLMEWVKRYRS